MHFIQTEMEDAVQWVANVMDHKTGVEKKVQVGEKNVTFLIFSYLYHSTLR